MSISEYVVRGLIGYDVISPIVMAANHKRESILLVSGCFLSEISAQGRTDHRIGGARRLTGVAVSGDLVVLAEGGSVQDRTSRILILQPDFVVVHEITVSESQIISLDVNEESGVIAALSPRRLRLFDPRGGLRLERDLDRETFDFVRVSSTKVVMSGRTRIGLVDIGGGDDVIRVLEVPGKRSRITGLIAQRDRALIGLHNGGLVTYLFETHDFSVVRVGARIRCLAGHAEFEDQFAIGARGRSRYQIVLVQGDMVAGSLPEPGQPFALALTGSFVVVANSKGSIAFWPQLFGVPPVAVWQGHCGAVRDLLIAPGGNEIISAGVGHRGAGAVLVWDAGDFGFNTAFLLEARRLAAVGDHVFIGQDRGKLTLLTADGPEALKQSPKGAVTALAGAMTRLWVGMQAGSVELWKVRKTEVRRKAFVWKACGTPVVSIDVSVDTGQPEAVVAWASDLRLFVNKKLKPLAGWTNPRGEAEPYLGAVFCRGSERRLLVWRQGQRVIDLMHYGEGGADWHVVREIAVEGFPRTVSVHGKGELVAIGLTDGTITISSVGTGAAVKRVPFPVGTIQRLLFAGNWLLAGTLEGHIVVLEEQAVATPRAVHRPGRFDRATFGTAERREQPLIDLPMDLPSPGMIE